MDDRLGQHPGMSPERSG